MRQAVLFSRRCRKELRRDSLFSAFCLALPAFLLLISRITVHYYASGAFSLVSLLAGALTFAQATLCLFIANLVSKDKESDYLLKLRLACVKPRTVFFGYMLSGIAVGFLLFFIGFFCAMFLSMFGINDVSLSIFFPSLLAQLPSLLFFVFTGIFCGTVFSERTSLVLSAFGMVLAVLLCGVYLPFSAFGPLATALSHLPYALGVALYAKATSHTVLFSIIYALSAAVFAFAAYRKRYLR